MSGVGVSLMGAQSSFMSKDGAKSTTSLDEAPRWCGRFLCSDEYTRRYPNMSSCAAGSPEELLERVRQPHERRAPDAWHPMTQSTARTARTHTHTHTHTNKAVHELTNQGTTGAKIWDYLITQSSLNQTLLRQTWTHSMYEHGQLRDMLAFYPAITHDDEASGVGPCAPCVDYN